MAIDIDEIKKRLGEMFANGQMPVPEARPDPAAQAPAQNPVQAQDPAAQPVAATPDAYKPRGIFGNIMGMLPNHMGPENDQEEHDMRRALLFAAAAGMANPGQNLGSTLGVLLSNGMAGYDAFHTQGKKEAADAKQQAGLSNLSKLLGTRVSTDMAANADTSAIDGYTIPQLMQIAQGFVDSGHPDKAAEVITMVQKLQQTEASKERVFNPTTGKYEDAPGVDVASAQKEATDAAAKQAGTERTIRTDPQRNIDRINKQNTELGKPTVTDQDFITRNDTNTPDKSNYQFYADQETAQGRTPKSFNQWKIDTTKAGVQKVPDTVLSGAIFKKMSDDADNANQAAQGLTSIHNARKAIKEGAILGAGADQRLALAKAAAFFGADPKTVIDTETFRAAIAPQVAAVLHATVGNANISDADRAFAEKAAGGNITLDPGSINRLLDIMERANTIIIKKHNAKVDKIYPEGDDSRSDARAATFVDAPTFDDEPDPQADTPSTNADKLSSGMRKNAWPSDEENRKQFPNAIPVGTKQTYSGVTATYRGGPVGDPKSWIREDNSKRRIE